MQAVFERLVLELEKPRPLTAQSLRHFSGTYGVGRDETGAFLEERLPGLAEEEIDLALSSLFTPKLTDQAPFAELLGTRSIGPAEWPAWLERLLTRPTLGCLVTEDGTPHRFPLRAVTLERFVHRLRLEGAVTDRLNQLIQTRLPMEDRPLLSAIARRAIWNSIERREILQHFLTQSCASDSYRRDDAIALLGVMESAEPISVADLRGRIPEWERSVRTQLATASQPRPFFNLQVEEMHGGGRDQRPVITSANDRHRVELEFLDRLARALAA